MNAMIKNRKSQMFTDETIRFILILIAVAILLVLFFYYLFPKVWDNFVQKVLMG